MENSAFSLRAKHLFFCIAASLASSFLVFYIFYSYMVDSAFYDGESCLSLSNAQVCYFAKNSVWSDSSYLQTITGFYTSIITVLIGIIAIVATVGAYTIKASIRAQAEQEMPLYVASHFDHVSGQNQVRSVVEDKMSAKINSLPIPENGPLSEWIASIERRLESIENLEEREDEQ